jgi:hypothetical protein
MRSIFQIFVKEMIRIDLTGMGNGEAYGKFVLPVYVFV